MLQSTQKNKHNKELLIMSIVVPIITFYVVLGISTGIIAENKKIIDVLNSNFLPYLNPVYIFENFTGKAFAPSLFIAFLATSLMLIVYISGRQRKHDMEGIEQGSAEWLVNVHDDADKWKMGAAKAKRKNKKTQSVAEKKTKKNEKKNKGGIK